MLINMTNDVLESEGVSGRGGIGVVDSGIGGEVGERDLLAKFIIHVQ